MKHGNALVAALIAAESNTNHTPGERELLRNERMRLQTALHSGNAERIRRQTEEARRVGRMYGADV